jgi:1-acyl-sn-glycerol-3-phosphate acyltransferase
MRTCGVGEISSVGLSSVLKAAPLCFVTGECLAISPEGTRSLSGHLLEFKKGEHGCQLHVSIISSLE